MDKEIKEHLTKIIIEQQCIGVQMSVYAIETYREKIKKEINHPFIDELLKTTRDLVVELQDYIKEQGEPEVAASIEKLTKGLGID